MTPSTKMKRAALAVGFLVAISTLGACSVSVNSSSPRETTSTAAQAPNGGADAATSGDLDASWEPAPFVEAGSPEVALAQTPAPSDGLCVEVTDMNLGDTADPLAMRVMFEQPGAEDSLAAVITLQQWTDPEGALINLDVMFRRNELTDDFPAVEGAQARLSAETPFPGSEGTPVAWARGSYTVLLSVTPGHEAELESWAAAVDDFLLNGTPGTTAPACP